MNQSWEDLANVRRKVYAITDPEWIRSFLKRAKHGVLATADDGQPFAYPRLYVYDEPADRNAYGAIYIHGAKAGRTWSNLQANPRVCFNIAEMGELLAAKKASEFNVNFASVVVFAEMYVVEDRAEAERGLQLLLDKYFPQHRPGRDYEPISEADIQKTAVYRLDIMSWSGKTHGKKD